MMAVNVGEVGFNILLSDEKILLTRFCSWAKSIVMGRLDDPHAGLSKLI